MCGTDAANGSSSANGANGGGQFRSSPYQPVGDYLSNVNKFKIIESTLRALDEFGVDYIELTSPAASEQSRKDCEAICKLGLKAKILTHVRCDMRDAKIAVETGVDGLDVVIGTSSFLREHSHGKDMAYIEKTAIEVIEYIKSKGLEVRLSPMPSARSRTGATHIDTSVLGIGERNGITPLGGLLARMVVSAPDYVKGKYKLHMLKEIEDMVAEAVEVNTPFNNPITGFCAFTHKAGIHAKAILNNPSTYEILNPADFGLTRYVHFASRLTGWNAVKTRVGQLGLVMTDDQVKEVTAKIKAMADVRPIAIDDADSIIRSFHLTLHERPAEPATSVPVEVVQ
ncbi:hypothetical protein CHGG_08832 [Chaetomium globosum CBS 148.51]|uniref:Pyruvate carboxyltransferase domain-containing protein n=1 Tax=Chaetomium globosum (strain ATCC 6205 / CBS 148.51 / DSM 1962 / NBRC 6347 / NRRL 1970) TaxID=306901 RepID=Q2GT72_CHAGB|nr:uncharacterized protein CHGG_08832 [Chaetomium globosum CBS 148.51]EAQ84818.1 hypothetical protein CHGG_08832 [Chaetomium globosum CBS 148.51]